MSNFTNAERMQQVITWLADMINERTEHHTTCDINWYDPDAMFTAINELNAYNKAFKVLESAFNAYQHEGYDTFLSQDEKALFAVQGAIVTMTAHRRAFCNAYEQSSRRGLKKFAQREQIAIATCDEILEQFRLVLADSN